MHEKCDMLEEPVIMWLNLGEDGSADSEKNSVAEQSARRRIMQTS